MATAATTEDKVIKFTDLGILDTRATRNIVLFGKVRSFSSLRKIEIGYLVMSAVSLTVLLVLTIYRLAYNVDYSQADFTFAIVLLLNAAFCLSYVLSGVFAERPYEVGILVISTGILWLYLVLNYAISIKGIFKLVRLIIASLLSPFIMVFGVLLMRRYFDSRNLIFRTVGANANLQEMCSTMFICYTALKADLQVSISLSLLILKDGKNMDTEDKIILPLFMCISLLSCIIGYCSVRFENKKLVLTYMITWVLMPGYAIYLIVTSAKQLHYQHVDDREIGLSTVTFIAAGLSLILRVCILFYGFKAYLNFCQGLRQKVYGMENDRTSFQSSVMKNPETLQPDENIQEEPNAV